MLPVIPLASSIVFVATVLTVYGIETLVNKTFNLVREIPSCNSAYRLRY